jgi:hypothetical protein
VYPDIGINHILPIRRPTMGVINRKSVHPAITEVVLAYKEKWADRAREHNTEVSIGAYKYESWVERERLIKETTRLAYFNNATGREVDVITATRPKLVAGQLHLAVKPGMVQVSFERGFRVTIIVVAEPAEDAPAEEPAAEEPAAEEPAAPAEEPAAPAEEPAPKKPKRASKRASKA